MFRSALLRKLHKNEDLVAMLLHRLPSFVYLSADHLTEIPVFTFHDVTRDALEPILAFLAENKYVTLDADELYERRISNDYAPGREVVLTFDDGTRSLYEVAYPLFQQYSIRAVAFIVPGMIDSASASSVDRGGRSDFCTWDQVCQMHRSGLVDFQVHSMYHHTIYTSSQVVNYVTPTSHFSFLQERFFPLLYKETGVQFPSDLPLGTPLYESASRYGPYLGYRDSVHLRNQCEAFVSERGGSAFFYRKNWRNELDKVVGSALKHAAAKDARFETPAERREAIRMDLRSAKTLTEEKLPNKTVRHFAFPWFEGSSSSAEICLDEGYSATFWGLRIPKLSDNCPVPIRRLHPLYIWRLPGKGRQSLSSVLSRRLSLARVLAPL
jgi:peptidoglycan/xylan/chitin deacetylase (PgdA/CDA1 family)